MEFSFLKSRLKKAIERGLTTGELDEKLKELGEVAIKSRTDAEAICWGLDQLDNCEPKLMREHAYALAGLFQKIEGADCAAFEILQGQGIPVLLQIFDKINNARDPEDLDTLLFILKILGMYGTVDGTLKIVEAARQPLKPDGYMWSVILRSFTKGHPEKELLYSSLSDPLPSGFIAVSLLDAANAILIEGDSMAHPFDTGPGRERLREWLTATDPEQFSYAHSATSALPLIMHSERDSLLRLAMRHPDPGVRMKAAWASAKLGNEEGLQQLVEQCWDFRTAAVARRYLSDLGREDLIPQESTDRSFTALGEFAQWLAHPNELGEVPDELEIVDHRELRWPPEREPVPFWLIKFTVRDKTGLNEDSAECGLVGSIMFCFFSYKLAQRPPEDAYAVHCYWEMEKRNLIEQSDVKKESPEYENLIQQWRGSPLANPQVLFVAELSPELNYAQRLVGLASGRLKGEEGWVVLDGERSEWYPRGEQPGGVHSVYDSIILKIHVGRYLLGFTEKPDRKKYLLPAEPPKSPEQIIAAYEKLLSEAQKAEGKKRQKAFRSYGKLGQHFDLYVDALIRAGRSSGIREILQVMSPYWNDLEGLGRFGKAAFKAGDMEIAEGYFVKYRNQCSNYERSEEMGLLAELWCRDGKQEAARELVLDCLRRLLEESKTATGSDEDLFEKWFQNKREVFLKLFPGDGEGGLIRMAVPKSTLRRGE